ncbi:MAG: glycosyltransferase family 39 protein [Anaerolineae bacterium]|nr:glycosyltransferase family 39 protein [Anaerolineae bacterium]
MRAQMAFWRHAKAGGPGLTDGQAMRVSIAVGCILASAFVGYAHVRDVHVQIVSGLCWQLLVWAFSVAVIIVALLPRRAPLAISGRQTLTLGLLGLAALLPRAFFLDAVGLHIDEQGVAEFALRHVFPTQATTINPFITGLAAHPTLYSYLVRLSLLLFGQSIAGLRMSSALGGALAVIATYAAVATCQSRRAGLIAAAVMAASHYHVHWSRIGLNNIWDTFWVPLAVAAYAWGWRDRWSGGAVLAGAALGLSQYFYPGARVGLFLVAWLALDLWRRDRDTRRLAVHVGKLLAVLACIALPLAMYAVHSPSAFFARIRDVYGWSRPSIVTVVGESGSIWSYLWHQVWRSVGAYTAVPEVTGFYRPNVPYLMGLAAPLFWAGLVQGLRKRQLVPVVWIGLATLFGGVLLNGAPSSSHMVVSIPALSWLVAMPIDWLFGTGRRRWAWAALALIVLCDLAFYFVLYVPNPCTDLSHPFPPGPFR